MSLAPGVRLGPYEIVGPLGAGGMGEVYRARDTRLNRDVAIKILPALFANDVDRLARFTREAQLLASLNHPHIATIHGLEEAAGVRALVLELVDGPTLADRIAEGPIPLNEALRIARQIAEALEAAHAQGVIHRDLKPANVKLTSDGIVKVLDFGLAKAVASELAPGNPSIFPTITSPAMTAGGVILGTAAYMSPEQARGKPVDRRTDVWAFGCVLFEMLTGKRAFEGEDVSDTLAAILRGEPDWTAFPADVPPYIKSIVRRCLEKDQKQRIPDVSVARYLIDEGPGWVPSTTQQPRRMYWPLAVMGIVTLAAIALAVFFYGSRGVVPSLGESRVNRFTLPAPDGWRYYSGRTNWLSISPDGTMVVFNAASSSSGRSSLWIRRLDSSENHLLPGTDDAIGPFWSPDSRFLGFAAHGKLRKMEVAGGSAQSIADVGTNLGSAWGPDGTIIFSGGNESGLYRVSAGGGNAVPVTSIDSANGEYRHGWPSFLPDGRHFIFLARTREPEKAGVYLASLDSKETKKLISADSSVTYVSGHLLFVRESTLMAQPFDLKALSVTGDAQPLAEKVDYSRLVGAGGFAVSQNGTLVYSTEGVTGPPTLISTQLLWISRTGKQLSVAAPSGLYGHPVLSPDQISLAFDRAQSGSNDVWITEFRRQITSRFTFQPPNNNVPIWSPDGRTIVFASSRNGQLDLFQRPSNASGPDTLLLKLSALPIVFPSDWSSDGRYIAYYRTDPKTQLDVWILPMFGDRKPYPFLNGDFNESEAQFSQDGKWVAYMSDESSSPQIYVQSFPTLTGKWQVSTAGGTQPRWRRDGKELFYVSSEGKLMAVAVNTGPTFQLDSPKPLFEINVQNSTQRQEYAVSPDGQSFLVNAVSIGPSTPPSPPLNLILNWPALLK
jgi:eukaryotic-like serine/threonine-protein kinase